MFTVFSAAGLKLLKIAWKSIYDTFKMVLGKFPPGKFPPIKHPSTWTKIFDSSRTAGRFFRKVWHCWNSMPLSISTINTRIFTLLHSRFFHQMLVWKLTKIKTLYINSLWRGSSLGRIHPAPIFQIQNVRRKKVTELLVVFDCVFYYFCIIQ